MDSGTKALNAPADPSGTDEVVAAVVVSYNPDAGFAARLAAVAAQVQHTIVVDNTADPAGQELVAGICRHTRCELRANGRNVGLAEALNAGIRLARERGATMVLTMDQDSTPFPRMTEKLLAAAAAARARGLPVGTVAPRVIDGATGRSSVDGAAAAAWAEAKLVITSGSLVPMSVFERVGLFRSDFFIDCIDQEFCLRLRRHGYRIVQSHRAFLGHRLGEPRIHYVLGRAFIPTNHSPSRRYHMARNLMWMSKLFLASEPAVILTMLFKLAKNSVLVATLEEDKARKLAAVVRGVARGLVSRPEQPPILA